LRGHVGSCGEMATTGAKLKVPEKRRAVHGCVDMAAGKTRVGSGAQRQNEN
jgi:hypothetical protein